MERRYEGLEEVLNMPLLKGGAVGWTGTAPFAFAAAKATQQIQSPGGTTTGNWVDVLKDILGSSADVDLQEMMKKASPFIHSEIKCPVCDK